MTRSLTDRRMPRHQTGAVLLIGMLLMLMITLVAAAVIKLSMSQTQVVNNEQLHTEADAAAAYALDYALNQPAAQWTAYDGATGTAVPVNMGLTDSADTGTSVFNVTVKNRVCRRGRVLKNSELIKQQGSFYYVAAGDAGCFGATGGPLTITDPSSLGSPNDNSLCATVLYQLEAEAGSNATATLLGATSTVMQGVEVRTDVTTLDTACK